MLITLVPYENISSFKSRRKSGAGSAKKQHRLYAQRAGLFGRKAGGGDRSSSEYSHDIGDGAFTQDGTET